MKIRHYNADDKMSCMAVFDSNCPHYFDPTERAMFEKWLDHQSSDFNYKSPTYTNSVCDAYYVIQLEDCIAGCGGFYVNDELKEVRLAWGMIDSNFHNKGLGTVLFLHRKEAAQAQWKGYTLNLGTSQHTYSFYEKMGFKIIEIEPKGYGEELDRIEMVFEL